MKKMDDIGLRLCYIQSEMFEKSIDYFSCSSPFFIKIFMFSSLATRMDNKNFIFETGDTFYYLDELKKTHKLKTGKTKYQTQVMKWIGFLYRYYAYSYDIPSKTVYRYIKPNELYGLYEAYHSLDIEEAINRINDAKKIKPEKNYQDYLDLAKKYYLY